MRTTAKNLLRHRLWRDTDDITEGAKLSAESIELVEQAWSAKLDDGAKQRLLFIFQEYVIDSRLHHASRASGVPPDLKEQKTRHRRMLKHLDAVSTLMRDDLTSGPKRTSIFAKLESLGLIHMLPTCEIGLLILRTATCDQPEPTTPSRRNKGRPSYRHWRKTMILLGALYEVATGRSPAPQSNQTKTSGRVSSPFWKGIEKLNDALPKDVRASSVGGVAEHMHRNKVLTVMLNRGLSEVESRRIPLRIVPRGENRKKARAKKRLFAP